MNLVTEILLWVISLTLATFGIVFSFLAQRNSRIANNRLEEMISATWIAEESQKYYFKNMQDIVVNNRKLLKKLIQKDVRFVDYADLSILTRFIPHSKKFTSFSQNSEYVEISTRYVDIKTSLDEEFWIIFPDFSLLASEEIMPKEFKDRLIKYHKNVIGKATLVMKEFSDIISKTQAIRIDKKRK